MKARIHIRDGHFASARTSLSFYIKAKGNKMDKEAEELDMEITEGERLKENRTRNGKRSYGMRVLKLPVPVKRWEWQVIQLSLALRNVLWQLGMREVVLEIWRGWFLSRMKKIKIQILMHYY
jgi:hypothetical protein